MYLEAFGKKLTDLRKKNRMTQDEAAQLCGISKSYLQFIESGKRTPTIQTVFKISHAFNISPNALLKSSWEEWKKDLNLA